MNIGEAASRSGVAAKTIRYYESVGLIVPADRTSSGYRIYETSDVQTLRFIHRARNLGFSVEDVGNLLTLWQNKDRASSEVKALATRHVARIDEKVAALAAMRDTLVDLMARCHGDNRPECPILADFAADPGPNRDAT